MVDQQCLYIYASGSMLCTVVQQLLCAVLHRCMSWPDISSTYNYMYLLVLFIVTLYRTYRVPGIQQGTEACGPLGSGNCTMMNTLNGSIAH